MKRKAEREKKDSDDVDEREGEREKVGGKRAICSCGGRR